MGKPSCRPSFLNQHFLSLKLDPSSLYFHLISSPSFLSEISKPLKLSKPHLPALSHLCSPPLFSQTKPTAHRPSLFLPVKVTSSVAREHRRIVGSALPAHSSENPWLSLISHISAMTTSSSHRWTAFIAGGVVQNNYLTRRRQYKN